MFSRPTIYYFVSILIFIISILHQTIAGDTNWPAFRGQFARGISAAANLPDFWDVEKNENIKWKISVPGLAHSSPVIWGNRIFLTTAISGLNNPELKVGLYGDINPVDDDTVHVWKVYCYDKETGALIWEQTAHQGIPKVKRHPKSTHANPTPVTDGKHVIAFFGSEGLYCYDMNGKLLWKKDLGILDSGFFIAPEAQWGFASSPVIHRDRVIVQCDIQKGSFIAAYYIKTGEEIWRSERDEVPTWSSPTVHANNGQTQIIVNGYKHIGGYNFESGQEIWKMRGGGDIPIPTPVVNQDLIYINNAHGGMSPIYAISTHATGDITLSDKDTSNIHIVWSIRRGGSYMLTPLVYDDYLYNCRINGSLRCYRAKTGELIYKESLGHGGFSASAVAANGKIYFTNEDGEVFVVAAGPEYKLLAINALKDICMATPAISDDTLFFRTQHYLIAVSEK